MESQQDCARRRRGRPLLGTFVEIGVSAGALPRARVDSAIDRAFSAVQTVHDLMSFQAPESDLTRLNGASGDAMAVHPLTFRLLRLALRMTTASGGLFNCTLGGALVRAGALPDHGVRDPLPVGTAEDIELEGGRARLVRPVLVTLDGIAKGFAVDLAVRALQAQGITGGVVNAGGDLRVFGDAAEPVWRRGADGANVLLGLLSNAAIATSQAGHGDPERFPGLMLDERALAPQAGIWSVLARQAWRADALTKVAASAPEAAREARIEALRGRLIGGAA